MKLFVVTGSSGIGKSTVLSFLRGRLGAEFDVHDFDERLIKEVVADGSLLDKWRLDTTTHWINVATENARAGKSTVVVGLVYPNEVTQLHPPIPHKLCLLDASDEKIKERLLGKRFSSPDKIAGLKQATGQTPEEFISSNKLLMDELRNEVREVQGEIIDTTADTPEETAGKISDWILKNN